MALIDNWKQIGRDFKDIANGSVKDVGKGIGKTAVDFGKTMVKSVQHTANKVDNWANGSDEAKAEEQPEEAKED